MSRFIVPAAFALLLLPSCGGSSDVSCAYKSGSTVAACADYSFSGDTQGQDVTTLEQSECTGSKGTVIDSCSTSNTLGICTITASAGGATVTAVEYFYNVNGVSAAQAESTCKSENANGVTATWSGS